MSITVPAAKAQIKLEGVSVPLTLKRVARARYFTLRYRPLARDALLTLPKRASVKEALLFAESRRQWLILQVREEERRVPFMHGTILPVLGERLTLMHRPELRGVRREGETLLVGGDHAFFSRRVHDWLKAEARREITPLAQAHAAQLGRKLKRVSVKDTSSRWGSCSADGALAFSWRMVFAPREVLEYLVAHEAAHLVEMNHSPRFWKIVAELCPAWKAHRHWLKREGSGLYLYG